MSTETMSTETPEQRRTRLIEEYAKIWADNDTLTFKDQVELAIQLADTVIAATPQEPATRYPSEIETRLIELVEETIDLIGWEHSSLQSDQRCKLAAIKRDLSMKE